MTPSPGRPIGLLHVYGAFKNNNGQREFFEASVSRFDFPGLTLARLSEPDPRIIPGFGSTVRPCLAITSELKLCSDRLDVATMRIWRTRTGYAWGRSGRFRQVGGVLV